MTLRDPDRARPARSRAARSRLAHPRLGRALPATAILAAAALSTPACTSFDDAVVHRGTFDFAEATAVCARVFACPYLASSLRQSIGAPVDDTNFSLCLSWLAGPAPEPPAGFAAQAQALRRVAAAPSCEAALAALDIRAFAPDDPRCEGTSIDRCTPEGDVIDCHDHRQLRCDGPQFAPGSACLVAGEVARCALGTCPVIAKAFACKGADLALCEPGVKLQQQIVCSASGETCVATGETVGLGVLNQKLEICTQPDNPAPSAVCTSNGAAACTPDGASVVLCQHVVAIDGFPTVGSVEILLDCDNDLQWRCEPGAPGSVASCVRPDPDCAPTDPDVNRCDGNTIAVCIAGRRARVDCAAAGATCQPAPSGPGAACVAAP